MIHQPSLFPDDPRAALATLKRSGIPLPVVGMLWRYGFHDGETCGTCASRLGLYANGVHRYCSRAFSTAEVPEGAPACKKWQAKR